MFIGGGATPGSLQGISGVGQSYSVGGSSDAIFRCQYCSRLLYIFDQNLVAGKMAAVDRWMTTVDHSLSVTSRGRITASTARSARIT